MGKYKTLLTRQRGLTMLGFLFVAGVVLIAALLAFRVIPAYIEYYSVQRTMEGALAESPDLTRADILRRIDRRLGAEYIDSVRASDVNVTRAANVTTATASWQTKLHLIGNASILLDFEAVASR